MTDMLNVTNESRLSSCVFKACCETTNGMLFILRKKKQ